MNIVLWVLQVAIALHTAMGAVWKMKNPEQAVPSLSVIPHKAWLGLSAVELLCCIGLLLPALRTGGMFAPISAGAIAFEMVAFSALHLGTGHTEKNPVIYWLVVAAVCAFLAYGRLVLFPL